LNDASKLITNIRFWQDSSNLCIYIYLYNKFIHPKYEYFEYRHDLSNSKSFVHCIEWILNKKKEKKISTESSSIAVVCHVTVRHVCSQSNTKIVREFCCRRDLGTDSLHVMHPDLQRNLAESVIQELLKMLGDTDASRRLHFLDNLFGVLIQELIHRLSDHVVAVQLIHHTESRAAETEIDQQSRNCHITNAVSYHFGTLCTSGRLHVTWNIKTY